MKVKVVFSIVQGQSRRTHVARGGSNVQVTVHSDSYGSTTLKSCMGLICYSRPDLIPNQSTDYAISVLDVQETDAINQDDKVWEGKGMMSWLLTEKGLGAKVVGRMTGTPGAGEDSQVLEVILELMPRTPILRKDLVHNLTSCSNIIETALSRALLSQNKQQHLLLSQSNTSSPAADQSNTATPLPINNNEESAPLPTPAASSVSVQAAADVPHDLPSMLRILQASQPGMSMSQAMVVLRNAISKDSNTQADASLLPSIDLLSASMASASSSGDSTVADLLRQQGLAFQTNAQAPKQTLQARNKGLLEVLSAPDLSPATSDILNRFTMGFKTGNSAETSTAVPTTARPSQPRTSTSKKDKDTASGTAVTTSTRKTSGTKRKAAETIEISDTERSRPLPDPVKPSTSSSSSLRPPPKASTSSISQLAEKRLKFWEPGCLKCGRTESIGWRIRKKRSTPLNGQKGEGAQEDDDEVKKLCEECAQDLPSVQRRRTGKGKKDNVSNLPFSDPLAPSSSMQPTPVDLNRHAQARTIHSIQTSPLRRSPRRNKGKSAGGSGLATVSMTSPVQAKTSNNNGNKRRKFTTALSKAALSEENRNTSVPPSGGRADEECEMTDSDANNNRSSGYLAISGKRGFSRGQSSPPRLQPVQQQQQNQSFDFMLDPASDLPDGFAEAAHIDTDFLMNASPGTAIRSALGGGISTTLGTPTNSNESPGKMLSRYLKDLQRGGSLEGMNLDIPAFEDLQNNNASTSRGNTNAFTDGNLFSPGGALSTPFRNAIFARAHSEQPPSSHQRLQSQLNGGGVTNNPSSDEMTLGGDLQINLQPPSADRRLATSDLLSRASPSLATKAGGDLNDGGSHPPSDSLAIVDDFSAFLLNTSSSLFSPSPPRNGRTLSTDSPLRKTLLPSYTSTGTSITKASLASLQLPTALLRRNSAPHVPLAPSSDFDIESNFDIRDLPPSSPPPLPSAHHHHSNMQIFLNSLGNNSLDDGQSPISATTSVTAGGTPQEVLLAPKPGLNPSFSLGSGSRNDGERDDWLDPSLRTAGTYSHKLSLSMDSACQDDGTDAFFDLFTNGSISDSGNGIAAAGASSNMGMTWSDSTASSASLSSVPNQPETKVGGNRGKSSLNTSASASPVDFNA